MYCCRRDLFFECVEEIRRRQHRHSVAARQWGRRRCARLRDFDDFGFRELERDVERIVVRKIGRRRHCPPVSLRLVVDIINISVTSDIVVVVIIVIVAAAGAAAVVDDNRVELVVQPPSLARRQQ